jgi:hypothetical protein
MGSGGTREGCGDGWMRSGEERCRVELGPGEEQDPWLLSPMPSRLDCWVVSLVKITLVDFNMGKNANVVISERSQNH